MIQLSSILSNCKQEAGLYIVSTPIGNIYDITIRALQILSNVDIILCEDTRTTHKLLENYNLKKTLICYNDHSTDKDRNRIIDGIKQGQSYAIVSDAGTPLISDPGYKLVRLISENNLKIIPIPGACAAIAALTVSSLPSDQFYFLGFLPAKTHSRIGVLKNIKHINTTIIIYETARRLVDSLNDISSCLGNIPVCVVRELTKTYEEKKYGNLQDIIKYYSDNEPKGECVIIIDNHQKENFTDVQINELIINSLKTLSAKDTASTLAEITGLSKKDIYDKVLKIKNS